MNPWIIISVAWLLLGAAGVFLYACKEGLPSICDAAVLTLLGPFSLFGAVVIFYAVGMWKQPWIHPRDLRWP